jgi:hypothetical protein
MLLPKPPVPVPGAGNRAVDLVTEVFAGAAIALVVGLYLAGISFLIAARIAHRNGFRLWLHADVALAQERQDWPPTYGASNELLFPVFISVFFLTFTLGTLLMFAFGLLLQQCGFAMPRPAILIISMLWIVGLPYLSLKQCDRLRTRVFAREPWECWDDPPPTED